MNRKCAIAVLGLLLGASAARAEFPADSAFTYQGQLKDNGNLISGELVMEFTLWDDPGTDNPPTGGNQIGPALVFDGMGGNPAPVTVTEGLFTVLLDFGASTFSGDARWLEIAVEGTALSPRQELTAAPYAAHALEAAVAQTATSVPWSAITDAPESSWAAGGGIMGWGSDSNGQISGKPAGSGIVDMAAGGYHAVAIRSDGSLVSWGDDFSGQVSDTPTGNNFAKVAGGGNHSIALRSDGSLVSWGYDGFGQVSNTPTGNDFLAVAAGEYHNVALRTDRALVSWGYDTYGQVASTPIGNGFKAVAAGGHWSVALHGNGTLVAWGHDDFGQVSDTPTGNAYVDVDAGDYHGVALRFDGSLVSWGYDAYGQVSSTPAGNDFTAVAAGRDHSVALRSDGSLVSWGFNGAGQVSSTPTGSDFTAVAAGGSYTLLLRPTLATNLTTSTSGAIEVGGDVTIGGNVRVDGGQIQSGGPIELRPDVDRTGDDVVRIMDSNGNENLRVHADGNVGIGTATPLQKLDVNGRIRVAGGAILKGDGTITTADLGLYSLSPGWLRLVSNNSPIQFYTNATSGTSGGGGGMAMTIAANGNVGIGTANPAHPLHMGGGAYCEAGATWTNASSRALKENFAAVDARQILERVAELPVQSWNYKAEDARVRHLGPMAQDFQAAFGLGGDDESIGTVDADGVALAAIQGLHQVVKDKDAEIAAIRSQNADLTARLEKLEAAMNRQFDGRQD